MSMDRPKLCPSTMCPLIAPDGSPWTGAYAAPCPGHDELDRGGCAWWSLACGGAAMAPHFQIIDEAEAAGGVALVAGPVTPRRLAGASRSYDCPKAAECRWQEQSAPRLCPPHEALRRGLDPRICNF